MEDEDDIDWATAVVPAAEGEVHVGKWVGVLVFKDCGPNCLTAELNCWTLLTPTQNTVMLQINVYELIMWFYIIGANLSKPQT